MEQTPLPPLVSRDRYAEYAAQYTYPTSRAVLRALEKFADLHEAHHAKTREVVQALVNHIAKMKVHIKPVSPPDEKQRQGVIDAYIEGDDALALAKSQLQIEPTKP